MLFVKEFSFIKLYMITLITFTSFEFLYTVVVLDSINVTVILSIP